MIINGLNGDYNTREKIIFNQDYKKENYSGGIRRFICSRETMQELLDKGFVDPNETQNESPRVKDFMDYTENFDNVTFGCYAVSPDRSDYRITIEEVNIEIPDDQCDHVAQAVETFRYADEFNFEHTFGSYILHAWWD